MAVTPVAATDLIPIVAADGVTGQNNARDVRLWLQGLVSPGSSGFTTRDGVLPRAWNSTDLFSSGISKAAGGSNTTITVQPAYVVISRSGQASYLWMLETAQNITLSNSDPTNPRIDCVFATAYDKVAFVGDPLHGAYITVVEGTASGTPVAPSTPAGSVLLTQWLRPANNNTTPGTPTQKRKSSSLLGAARPLLEGDALSDPGQIPGETRYRVIGTGNTPPVMLDVWDGATWRAMAPRRFSGAATSGLTLSTTLTDVPGATVTFSTINANATARVWTKFDWDLTGTGTGFANGYLVADSVPQLAVNLVAQSVETRATSGQVYDITLAAAGSHTLKLAGNKDVGSGTVTFNAPGTRFIVELWD